MGWEPMGWEPTAGNRWMDHFFAQLAPHPSPCPSLTNRLETALKATLKVWITNGRSWIKGLTSPYGSHDWKRFDYWTLWRSAIASKECRDGSSAKPALVRSTCFCPLQLNLVLHCCKVSAYSLELAYKWFGSPHTCFELESNSLSLNSRWIHTHNGRAVALRSAWIDSITTSCRFCTPRYDHVLHPPSRIERSLIFWKEIPITDNPGLVVTAQSQELGAPTASAQSCGGCTIVADVAGIVWYSEVFQTVVATVVNNIYVANQTSSSGRVVATSRRTITASAGQVTITPNSSGGPELQVQYSPTLILANATL